MNLTLEKTKAVSGYDNQLNYSGNDLVIYIFLTIPNLLDTWTFGESLLSIEIIGTSFVFIDTL